MLNYSIPKNNGTSYKDYIGNEKQQSLTQIAIRTIKLIYSKCKKELLLQVLCVILGCSLPVLVSYQWKGIVEILVSNNFVTSNLNLIARFLFLTITGSLAASFFYFSEIIDTIFRNSISLKLQGEVHKKSQYIPVSYYEAPELNDTIKKAQGAFCYGPAVGFVMSINIMIGVVFSLIASSILLCSFNYWLFSILIAIAIPNLFKLKVSKSKFNFTIQSSSKRRESDVYKKYFTKYDYIKETQILNAKEYFIDKWFQVMNEIKNEEIKVNKKVITIETVVELISGIGHVFSIFIAIYLVYLGNISIAEFSAVLILIGTLKGNLGYFFSSLASVYEGLLVVRKGFEYMDLKEEYRPHAIIPEIKEDVICENISYSYPLSSKRVINNLNIKIKKGEVIAIVGPNGAGKSTLSNILLGLLSPTEGSVKYDGVDISKLTYEALHHNTSAVFQNYNRYLLNIRENIGLSDIKNIDSKELLLTAAKKSGAISFIEEFPNKLDTPLGKEYGGTELSGGQWQQLALARGYFKASNFIVLDEPSSALDPYKEATMYKAFKELCTNKIGIIITHRLGAASLADKIFLMKKGSLVEVGTHKELCEMKGLYWEMFNTQAQMYQYSK